MIEAVTRDPRTNDTESFNIGVNIPFGGSEHLQPQIAALNVELNRLIADREQFYRDLELAHHEAEHNLEVNEAELEIANELKRVAEEHLGMMQLSFSVGNQFDGFVENPIQDATSDFKCKRTGNHVGTRYCAL